MSIGNEALMIIVPISYANWNVGLGAKSILMSITHVCLGEKKCFLGF